MKTLLHIFLYEWKNLWRSKTLKVLILVVFGAGIYGIYFGKFEIDHQNNKISQVQKYERQQFDSLLYWVKLDTSVFENKEKIPTGCFSNRSRVEQTLYLLPHA